MADRRGVEEDELPVDVPYKPRSQFVAFHKRTQRWAFIVAHRRAGKTVACVNDLIRSAVSAQGLYAYVAPFYSQAKDVAWGYVRQYASVIPGVEFNESELRADFPNGSRVRLYGADNYDRMRGLGLSGVVMDEGADMDPRAWSEVIRPALSDRQGWAVWIGSAKGRNAFYDLYVRASQSPDWACWVMRASETGIIPSEELRSAREEMTEDQYAQEYECSFDAVVQGVIYKAELTQAQAQGRITAVPWRSELGVITSWDLGFDDATAIWFGQIVGREVHWFDYLETSGEPLTEIIRRLKEKPYVYSAHYLPHDVEQHELITGVTRRDTLQQLGMRPIEVAPRQNVWERINATRVMMSRFVFDENRCALGLSRLWLYRRRYDAKRNMFSEEPLHDDKSHAADALGTFCQSYKERAVASPPLRPKLGTLA